MMMMRRMRRIVLHLHKNLVGRNVVWVIVLKNVKIVLIMMMILNALFAVKRAKQIVRNAYLI